MELNWARLQRFRYIEWHLAHTGQINRADLVTEFCISEIQASKDFSAYQLAAPENLVYDKVGKTYRPSPTFARRYPQPRDLLGDLKYLRSTINSALIAASDRAGDSRGSTKAHYQGEAKALRAVQTYMDWLIDVRHRPGGPHPLANPNKPSNIL